MLEVKNLVKRYGNKYAVDDISFTVERGEILGFLGPNGAGKSTTMNIITGYLSSTEGTVTIDGHEILEDPIAAKSHIGYLPEQPPLYMDMTVKEYLNFMYELKKVKLPRQNISRYLPDSQNRSCLYPFDSQPFQGLQTACRRGAGSAGQPELLILDEPTVGLDPKQIMRSAT